jgi:hypothetical protein
MNSYIFTKKIDVDREVLRSTVYKVAERAIRDHSAKLENDSTYFGKGSPTTRMYKWYNFFEEPEAQELFKELQIFFKETFKPTQKYVIQSWVNIHKKGEFLGWHGHWPREAMSYHGYFCVDAEPSFTSYKIPGHTEDVAVPNKDGVLLVSPSQGDKHCVSEWKEDRDRITIAFDIVPWIKVPVDNTHMIPFI